MMEGVISKSINRPETKLCQKLPELLNSVDDWISVLGLVPLMEYNKHGQKMSFFLQMLIDKSDFSIYIHGIQRLV